MFKKPLTVLSFTFIFFLPLSSVALDKCISPLKTFKKTKTDQDLNVFFQECEELSTYLTNITFNEIYLGFANPSISSPMSYFGHTFLLFKKNDFIDFSKTLSYSAKIPENISFISLMKKGITSDLDGRLIFQNFYEIKDEYLIKEQRNLFLYKLRLSNFEKKLISLYVYENYNKKSSYNFFYRNCTSELINLLKHIKPSLQSTVDSRHYYQPLNALHDLKNSGLIDYQYPDVFFSKQDTLFSTYLEFSSEEKNNVNTLLSIEGRPTKHTLSNKEAYFINSANSLKFKYEHEVLPNYDSNRNLKFQRPEIKPFTQFKPINNTISYISLGILKDKDRYGYNFTYKPLLTDKLEKRFSYLNLTTLSLFKVNLEVYNQKLSVGDFEIFKLESFNKDFSIFKNFSTRAYLGINQTSNNKYLTNLQLGYGKTFGDLNFNVSIIPQLFMDFSNQKLDAGVYSLFAYTSGKASYALEHNLVDIAFRDNLKISFHRNLNRHYSVSIEHLPKIKNTNFQIKINF